MELVRKPDGKMSFGCSVIDRDKQVLCVVNECELFPENPMNNGRVYSFRINPETGDLKLLSRRPHHRLPGGGGWQPH